ncbi:hypothetical protein HTY52_08155 [Cupriavidus taiwanensis]|uniref:hypothetical protein n=1 Tax=Cupriavidus taiwanensis TaxID=164546 RepID=UPI0015729739|nr:hypothetical protein [Cupriavidus taiwanensis]NSX14043.1 hypothetical protein [Cupriavidus taiwanensis]
MKAWRWFGAVAVGVIAVLLISLAGATTFWTSPYKPDLMASWVQAVGSIAAIGGGVAVLRVQLRHAEAQRKADRDADRAALGRQLALLASDACEMIETLRPLNDPEDVLKHVADRTYAARVPAWRQLVGARADDLVGAVANLLRSGAIELDDLQPVWKLQKLLHEVRHILAGIDDPARQLDGRERGRIADIESELKVLRFRMSVAYHTGAAQAPVEASGLGTMHHDGSPC